MLSRLTIRTRITAGSVFVAAVIFVIALVAVRGQVAAILSNADSTLAKGDLTTFINELVTKPSSTLDDPGTGVMLYVRSPSGTVQVDTMPHAIHEQLDHRGGADEQFTGRVDNGGFVVVGRVVKTAEGEWSLWAARSEASSDLVLSVLDTTLMVGAVVLLAAFGLASWLLASAALRPVEQMRRRAEALGDDPHEGGLPVGPARDEIAQLATTLNALLDRIRRSADREKQMVSDAAHELRTPLSVLRTQLELAHDNFGDAEALGAQIVAAEVSVDRLSSLATNLLELSRLESKDARPKPSSFEQLVTELMASVDRARMLGLAREIEVGFTVESRDDLARFAIGTDGFSRLVDNLLTNSMSAVDEGGTVFVTLTQDGTNLSLTVRDDGPGMPESFIPHAFDRFSRPDDSRTSSTGGSGLGLALVAAIANDAGGVVDLANGKPGLVATVTLPQM
ncbi:MAG: Signal transduction histidine kinase [Microbacteriaceae bacterium]|jgi:two-component system OmpR family sensor kinase|nr:Signal transduction histidine kinase [Microbacteriaceae bacterium]